LRSAEVFPVQQRLFFLYHEVMIYIFEVFSLFRKRRKK